MGKLIYHQSSKVKKYKKSPEGFQCDHIIPFAISNDNSDENLQFLTIKEHKEKTKIDFKILGVFRKKGWTEKVTNYCLELHKPIPFLVEEYKKMFSYETG